MKIFSLQPNYDEKFPHLNNAPIVEAVIDLQVVSIASWNDKLLKAKIQSQLPNYPTIEEGREMKYILGLQCPPQDLGCVGFRAISGGDGFYIAQFNQRGFTLSRVKKYDHWIPFCAETSQLWSLYRELLHPTAIKRIGVRFINRMLADYESRDFLAVFRNAPKEKQISGWELENFLHRDVLRIPNTDYRVNLIKTVVSSPTKQNEVAAILDCDVFYNQDLSCEWDDVAKHLRAMHWVKNKVFFESITKKKIKEYK